ncbi:MAG: hypothetical protein ACOX9C_09440 [Kiritimatiellia bacterium]|jgi:hypothetical protein
MNATRIMNPSARWKFLLAVAVLLFHACPSEAFAQTEKLRSSAERQTDAQADGLTDLGRNASVKPDSPVGQTEDLEKTAIEFWRRGVLDRLCEMGGALPSLDQATTITNFPALPANDPCNPSYWTLPVVMWTTSHYATVRGETLPDVKATAPIPPELTLDSIADYQKTLLRAIAGMRLICGIPDSGPGADAFDALWGPFVENPSTEGHLYFARLNVLLDGYFVLLAQIEGDLEAARETWRLAANAAVFQDEASARELLDTGFIIAQRLKDLKRRAEAQVARIVALGNPPNPLQAQCRARKRHQGALALVNDKKKAGGRWTLVNVDFNDRFTSGKCMEPAPTSVLYVRPKEGQFYKYDYEAAWQHPPLVVRPGDNVILKGTLTRTSLDAHPFECNIAIPRMLRQGPKDSRPRLSRYYNVAFRQEQDFFFAMEGAVVGEGDEQAPRMRLVLEPFAGTHVDESSYDQTKARWIGKRDYIYAWDAGERMTPLALEGAPQTVADAAARATPERPADEPKPPADAPIMTAEEIKSAIEHHESVIAGISRHLERTREEHAREANAERKQALDEIIVMHVTNIQIEQDRIRSLQLGRTVRTRTAWEERAQQKFIERIEREMDDVAHESKLIKGLPRMAENRVEGGTAARKKMMNDIADIYQSPLPREERIKRLRALRTAAQQATLGEQKHAHAEKASAENKLWYAEKVQTASRLSLMLGALFVPGGGYVAMAYSVGTGYVEGGPAKAAENAVRIIDAVDVAWAAYDGYYAQEFNPETGRLEYRGWQGAAENAAITFVVNKAFRKIGERTMPKADIPPKTRPDPGKRVVDATPTTSTGARKGGIGPAGKPVGDEPKFDAFVENVDRMKIRANEIDAAYSRDVPRRPDGSINTADPTYPAIRQKYTKQRQALEADFGVIARRERLKQDLADCTKKHEARIPPDARNSDGSVNPGHPAYRQVKQEWEADMAGLRKQHNEGYRQRMEEQKAIIRQCGLENSITLSGGEPKSIMSDIDHTAADMASGRRFVQAMRDKGHDVIDCDDRWIIPGADTVVWKPPARPDVIGSAAQSASAYHGTVRGSDKFATEGGVHYTTQGKAGVEDPVGAVIANVKKATEAGIGGTHEPDFHVIGKSVDKAVGIANSHGANIDDPAFAQKARLAREHKIPEEAGIMTFGNPDAIKRQESGVFLKQARRHMTDSMVAGEKASLELNAKRIAAIRKAEAAGDRATAKRMREELVRARTSNEASMQSLAAQDPAFIQQIHQAVNSVPPSTAAPKSAGSAKLPGSASPQGATGTTDSPDVMGGPRSLGYGAILKKLGITADPDKLPATPTPPAVAAAAKALSKQIVPSLPPGSSASAYFSALDDAFQQADSRPAEAARAVQALSGYDMGKVANDLVKAAGGGTSITAGPKADVPAPKSGELRGMSQAWIFIRIPVVHVERGPLGFSNEKATRKDLVKRTACSSEPFRWKGDSFGLKVMAGWAEGKQNRYTNEKAMIKACSYWTKTEFECVLAPGGTEIAQFIYREIGKSERQESYDTLELHGIPLTERKVFDGKKPLTMLMYSMTGANLHRHFKDYESGSEHTWPEGRWKHEVEDIRWDATDATPRFVLILSPPWPKSMTSDQQAAIESWLNEQRDGPKK